MKNPMLNELEEKAVAEKMGMSYINAKVIHKKALTALLGMTYLFLARFAVSA